MNKGKARKSEEVLCADCAERIGEENWWLDDGAILCRHCAGQRRILRARRNEELYQAQQWGET